MAKHANTSKTNGRPPAGTTHFEVLSLTKTTGQNADGKRYTSWRGKRLTGDADADGMVTKQWPIAELSPLKIRKRWGPGRYRIRYVNEGGDLLGSQDIQLETPANEVQGEPLDAQEAAPVGDGSPASRLRGVASQLNGGGVMELMLLMQDNADRAAARARDETRAQADRDRMFMQQQQQQFQSMLGLFVQQQPRHHAEAAAGAGGAAVSAREVNLMGRELALTMREEMARFREQVLGELDDRESDSESAGEAFNRAGVAAVDGLGQEVPGIVGEALGAFRNWLKARGQPHDPATMAVLIQAAQQEALAAAQHEAQNGAADHDPE